MERPRLGLRRNQRSNVALFTLVYFLCLSVFVQFTLSPSELVAPLSWRLLYLNFNLGVGPKQAKESAGDGDGCGCGGDGGRADNATI